MHDTRNIPQEGQKDVQPERAPNSHLKKNPERRQKNRNQNPNQIHFLSPCLPSFRRFQKKPTSSATLNKARTYINPGMYNRRIAPIAFIHQLGSFAKSIKWSYLLSVSYSLLAFSQEVLIAWYESENPFFICSQAPAELFLKLPYHSASSFLCWRSAFRLALAF